MSRWVTVMFPDYENAWLGLDEDLNRMIDACGMLGDEPVLDGELNPDPEGDIIATPQELARYEAAMDRRREARQAILRWLRSCGSEGCIKRRNEAIQIQLRDRANKARRAAS
jgi:hypothetical protein